mgnify:CR=1 FL=1|tara:strand:- start:180 stop:377 length:198 start_codon:yes stop_codon:yes gene_type:complete
MADQVIVSFKLEDDCCPDIQLMSIWIQAAKHFSQDMTLEQYAAALSWFDSYIKESFADDLMKQRT